MDEYIEVLTRPKFSLRSGGVPTLLQTIRDYASLFPLVEAPYKSPDSTDTKFLQCAFAASADFIVTGNKRHFPAAFYGSTQVVNTRELLEHLDLDLI